MDPQQAYEHTLDVVARRLLAKSKPLPRTELVNTFPDEIDVNIIDVSLEKLVVDGLIARDGSALRPTIRGLDHHARRPKRDDDAIPDGDVSIRLGLERALDSLVRRARELFRQNTTRIVVDEFAATEDPLHYTQCREAFDRLVFDLEPFVSVEAWSGGRATVLRVDERIRQVQGLPDVLRQVVAPSAESQERLLLREVHHEFVRNGRKYSVPVAFEDFEQRTTARRLVSKGLLRPAGTGGFGFFITPEGIGMLEQAAAAPTVDDVYERPVEVIDARVLEGLKAQVGEDIARCYEQACKDLSDENRVSFVGPAAEVRLFITETLSRLAPDAEFNSMPGFVPDSPTGCASWVQRAKHILDKRHKALSPEVEKVLPRIDAGVERLAKTIADRSSRGVHTTEATRDELHKLLLLATVALMDLLL